MKAVLIYDGECPVCVNAIGWIRARAGKDAFEFLSCHSESLPARYPSIDKSACLQAMHLVLPDGTVLAGEEAAPEILARLPGYRPLAFLFRLPGARLASRAFYRWLARNRFHLSKVFFPHGTP